ncbi:RRXRR domain-containing protein [Streptomyces sp. NPDC059468]|uniref:RRXRR domain-containing protein n=1 Tax=Streptomyces sp. NPDC059468 TaxID=3346845 RepID=UPI00367A4952
MTLWTWRHCSSWASLSTASIRRSVTRSANRPYPHRVNCIRERRPGEPVPLSPLTRSGNPTDSQGSGREHGRGETDGPGTRTRRRHAKRAAQAAQAEENGSGDAPTGASRVFVLSKDGHPLMPCHPARARELLSKGRAAVAPRPTATPWASPRRTPWTPCPSATLITRAGTRSLVSLIGY